MSALAQHTMATLGIGGQRRRRRAGPVGFRALGGLRGFGDTSSDVKAIQTALNRFNPTALARLTVDGISGSKTTARLREFQHNHGLVVTGQADATTLQVLGLSSGSGNIDQFAASDMFASVQTALTGAQSGPGVAQTVFDVLTLKGLRDVAANEGTAAATAAAKTLLDAGNATKESANAALKFLADNGNLFAKIALAAGVSLGIAQAIAIGGAGFILILLLKGKGTGGR